jgi:hypothetical protein
MYQIKSYKEHRQELSFISPYNFIDLFIATYNRPGSDSYFLLRQ